MRNLILGIFLLIATTQSAYAQTGRDTTKLPEGLSTFINEPDTFFWNFDLDTTTACPIAQRYLMAFMLNDLVHPESDGQNADIEFVKADVPKHPFETGYKYRMMSNFDVAMSPSLDKERSTMSIWIETWSTNQNEVGGYRMFSADIYWTRGRCTAVQVSSSKVTAISENGIRELGEPTKDRKALEEEFQKYVEVLERYMSTKKK